MSARPDWLNRYLAGEREQVWHELRQLGDRVRTPGLAEEAQAVCDEMAHRARGNIEMIVGRLDEQGHRFHENNDDQTPVEPYAPPGPGAESYLQWLEERLGSLPMTLSSWMRIVGDVWLVGTHPRWQSSADADPLVFEVEGTRKPAGGIREHVEQKVEDRRADGRRTPFLLPVAPDHFHKANVSGGGPYGIVLPDGCADAHFVGEIGMPLVGYLTLVFQNGGFPRPTGDDAQWDVLYRLGQGLEPL
ncbi:hypothetical protein GCM10023085_63250 [Actinomadura viridis]|uniref:Uncharacterized protein n=1 Tax=Actinomadura viridis TaxID=58110 RepID=A0A931D9M5_9ACTN|nr:hypothetical protein [Actinomadura viridis]MBG6086170.1 hypothetical protein [Actinomadura viridis]